METRFDPLIEEWFMEQFGEPTEPQIQGWPAIRTGDDVLISAPTGSGKTLAAFLICLDQLVREARAGDLPDETRVVYVSPLKALSNDVRKNLEIPLAQIRELAEKRGVKLAAIRTAVRTGDTPMYERQQMGRKPPHILVTTPESLYILMTAEKSRAMLRTTRTVIVDEIHAIADDKRGSHLALTLARLDALVETRPQRIGLSATVKPIEEVANFIGPKTRIVNAGHRRDMDLGVLIPRDELGPIATHEMWAELYDRIAELIQAHHTTLVFVNTRRLSERVAHALTERLGAEVVASHHGSLSRLARLDAETRLKNGDLRAVVATASLELGIDIGSVDLVIQIGSTRSIAVALQRFGRAGHWVRATPKARVVATTRDELIECAALIRAIRLGDLERLHIPENALDILSQQIVAMAACEPWDLNSLFDRIRTAWPYRNLPRGDFDQIVEMLSEGITTTRGRSGAFLHLDRVNGSVRGRRGARLAAITSGGAIPENANYTVTAEPDGRNVGTLDEDFAVESLAGDVFLLGTHSWRIKRVSSGRVFVEDAKGAPPTVPFWLGEAPGRSTELSHAVSETREKILALSEIDSAIAFLTAECGLDEAGARQAIVYVRAGAESLGAMPSESTVIAERFFDEGGGMQLVLHAPFGSRINRAWGLALRKRFCRTFNFELQAAATDNGVLISLTEGHAFPLELVFEFLKPQTLEHVLTQALLDTPMFTSRWRWNASRALAILRFRGGGKVPAPIQRTRSDDLLASVFPDQAACAENLTGEIRIPNHPLVRETLDNCLHEAMDLDGLHRIIEAITDGTIRTVAIDNPAPSPFSHEILNANPYAFLDDAPLEERRARAVSLRGSLRTDFVGGAGILDPAAIAQVSEDAWPEVRDPDELHDALLSLIRLQPAAVWQSHFDILRNMGRASVLIRGERVFWIATERLGVADDSVQIVRGWMESLGPTTVTELSGKVALRPEEVAQALAVIEAQGQVLQGRFSVPEAGVDGAGEIQWCNRRILARIHHLTLGRLRREIEPVSALDLHRFLCRWQHLAPGSQLHGAEGTLQIIRQLQGYELPASAWEPEILSRRIKHYDPTHLDELCLSGEVMWGRLSPHPAIEDGEGRRVRPTRVAPISFFLRESLDWLLPGRAVESGLPDSTGLSPAAHDILAALRARGASFFADLTRASGRLASEVEDALWELVAAGLVTADGFENLRALIDPRRRRGQGRERTRRPRHSGGRWALMQQSGNPMLPAARAEAFVDQLILRWGVLIRDLLTRESTAPFWRELLPVLRLKEARGELRAGRFVAGFSGEQFAAPEAVELLRSIRRPQEHPEDAIQIRNSDPLNLAGILLPGPRVNTLSIGTHQLNPVP